jgi:ABC-type sugar transport system ATPase subunit
MATITVDHVSVDFGGNHILRDVCFEAPDGTFVGVAGPSGSGKTTLLRAIAGVQELSGGRILFDGVDVVDLPPAMRDIGMVFQHPALIPSRHVERNISFPLEVRHEQVDEIRRRVSAEVRALHLEHLVRRKPNELSLGEAHLVQIARAMVRVPTALLLDEPLANLDEPLKHRMRHELAVLQRGYGVTTLLCSNDPRDVVTAPSMLVVLEEGEVVQVGDPGEVLQNPETVGAAVATGEMSMIPVVVEHDAGGMTLVARSPDGTGFTTRVGSPAFADRIGDTVLVGVRIDGLRVSPADPTAGDADGLVVGRVRRVLPGSPRTVLCDIAGSTTSVATSRDDLEIGQLIGLEVVKADVFDTTSGRTIR